MQIHLVAFVLFATQYLSLYSKQLTLRLRLPNGQLTRIEADDDEDIRTFKERLQSEGKIPTGSSMAVKGIIFEDEDQEGGSSLSTLGITNGEIISVRGVNDEKKSKAVNKLDPVSTDSPARGRKQSSTKKSMMSNADIEERRKSLVKIARQKSTGKRYVSVTPTAANILKRLAFSKQGGVAVLIGRTIREKDSHMSKISRARERTLAKMNRKSLGSFGSDIVDDCGRECIEVHALFELALGDAGRKDAYTDLSSDATTLALVGIAKKMGLSVVGVGVSVGTGRGEHAKRQTKAIVWSSVHVHRALQVRQAVVPVEGPKNDDADSRHLFCVLSVAQNTGKGEGSSSSGKTKSRVDLATREANPGVLMEAFELSKQALELHRKGILTKMPISSVSPAAAGKRDDKDLIIAGERRKRGRPVLNKMNMAGPNGASETSQTKKGKDGLDSNHDMIQLASAVLTQSDESTSIDPLLLAVPLPIVAINANAPTVKKKENRSAVKNRAVHATRSSKASQKEAPELWRPDSLGITFEHSFPSPVEIRSNPTLADEAEAHLCEVCWELSHPSHPRHKEMFQRLRDVHILHRLSQLMESRDMDVLCATLGKADCIEVPSEISHSFELLQLSLSTAFSASSSLPSTQNEEQKPRKRRGRRVTREMRARGETWDDQVEEI